MTDVETKAAKTNPEDEEDGSKAVPCCVDPITFLCNLHRWKDFIGGLLLTITTTIAFGLAVVCYQGVTITEEYDTCPMVSIASCIIIVISNYMIWQSGNINVVYAALEKDKDELQVARVAIKDGIDILTEDTRTLNQTAVYLKKTAKNMTSLQRQMKSNTIEMKGKMIFLKEQRKDLGSSLNAVTDFLDNLTSRDDRFKENLEYLYEQLDILSRYLKNLENARNTLTHENSRLEKVKNDLESQLQQFQVVKEDIMNSDQWANNVFEMASYIEQRYIQLLELTSNYERNYIMQVVHQCEFIDGKPGWNESKVQELCERLPPNCPEKRKEMFLRNYKLVSDASPDGKVDYRRMEELVKEQIIPYTETMVKENGPLTSTEELSLDQSGISGSVSYDNINGDMVIGPNIELVTR